jgi:hypothetical protein
MQKFNLFVDNFLASNSLWQHPHPCSLGFVKQAYINLATTRSYSLHSLLGSLQE